MSKEPLFTKDKIISAVIVILAMLLTLGISAYCAENSRISLTDTFKQAMIK